MTYRILIAHYRNDLVSGAENSITDFVCQAGPSFQFTMLVPGESRQAAFFRRRGLDVWVRRVETPRRILPGLHQIQSALLAREIRRRGFDAVIANTFPALSRVSTAARRAGKPLGVYLRDYTPDTPLHRRLLARADALFAISQDVIDRHSAMAPAAKFHLTYNFIDPQPVFQRYEAHLNAGKRFLNFPDSEPVVGLVGRITPYKQPDLFVRAAARVLAEVPQARFVVIGAASQRDGEYAARVQGIAVELGIAERVAVLGQRPDALELTSEFTVATLASGREPLGRVVLEAPLFGVAVGGPDTGGPAEIVIGEETGLRFSSQAPDASEQFAAQIIRLLKDPQLRQCLSNQARERVMTTFASHKHVAIQEKTIEQLTRVHHLEK